MVESRAVTDPPWLALQEKINMLEVIFSPPICLSLLHQLPQENVAPILRREDVSLIFICAVKQNLCVMSASLLKSQLENKDLVMFL